MCLLLGAARDAKRPNFGMAFTRVFVCAVGLLLLLQPSIIAKVIDFEHDAGGRPNDFSNRTAWHNGAALNASLNALQPGTSMLFTLHAFLFT